MRAFCATAALCLAVAFVPCASALAAARHHRAKPHETAPSNEDRKPSLFMHPESAGGRFRME